MTEINFEDALNDPRYLIRIDELGLSTRLKNALTIRLWDRDRIFLIDVIRETAEDLISSPNLGKKTIGELLKALGDFELSVGVNVTDYPESGSEARMEAARQRFEADGSIQALLAERAMKREGITYPELAEARVILFSGGFAFPQIREIEKSPELAGELGDLFERAKRLTERLGALPIDRMLMRPDDVARALSVLKKDRTPE